MLIVLTHDYIRTHIGLPKKHHINIEVFQLLKQK